MPTDINKGANIKEAEIREFTWLNFDENKALYKIVFKEKPGEEIKEVSAYWAWKRVYITIGKILVVCVDADCATAWELSI